MICLFKDVVLVLEFILNIIYSLIKVASNTFSEMVPVLLSYHILLTFFIVVLDDLIDIADHEPLIIDWYLVFHLVPEMIINFYSEAFWQHVVFWLCIPNCQIRMGILVAIWSIFQGAKLASIYLDQLLTWYTIKLRHILLWPYNTLLLNSWRQL